MVLAHGGRVFACSSGAVNSTDDTSVYALVRGSGADLLAPDPSRPPLRILVATFDNSEGTAAQAAAVNGNNCARAAEMFMAQPGVSVRFWCEQGRFRQERERERERER